MNTMKVTIATPNGEVFSSEDIKLLTLETHTGSLGIMANHEPLVTTLKIGVLKVVNNKDVYTYFAVSEGFAECHGKDVSILVQSAESAATIDIARAERAKVRAEQRISLKGDNDLVRAELALAKAITRLKVVGMK
ncbi:MULTISPECIES: F0F1 ATP synthase subunit epsilon [unclassified Gemella]|uniref:F0F1 ATP synthase subunit epsilon n=1 Tax=unclassified Gemella TaxID=2624949 RepID=UPI0015D0ADF9|nr:MULTISPECIES: F0F1 ATP synthase subunit epsilon [unclassified Gemella]MBF0709648.1 F0F1 ATP synthase subunit epsilon [Gemella sp. GL1.1]NYS26992.1 F0F1 ATP synthase subunit epsilon [Gemella sp. GL1]